MSTTIAADMPSKEAARENVRTEYKDKQKVKNLTSDNEKTIELFAIWEKVIVILAATFVVFFNFFFCFIVFNI